MENNFKNTYKIGIIALITFGLMASSNLSFVYAGTDSMGNQETTGKFTITQQGIIKPLRSVNGPEHNIVLNMSGTYTFNSGILKINSDSFSGTLAIDDNAPISLDITKISFYKNFKTMFYRSTGTDVGNISGKLKFAYPLDFEESDNPSTITGSSMSLTMDSLKYYASTEGDIFVEPSQISPINTTTTQIPSLTQCDTSLWDHIYHPNRLQIVQQCITVSGMIEKSISEKDGDYHIRVKLDPQYSNLINSVNNDKQHGDLVVEPICQHTVTQADAISACQNFNGHVNIPPVGTRVKITGSYVLDLQHGGWAEIHPVTSITAD